MKKVFNIIAFLLILALPLFLFTGCAVNSSGLQLDVGVLTKFLVELIILGALSAPVVLLINLGKQIGLIKDGTSQYWSMGLSLAVLVAAIVVKVFNPSLLAATVSDTINYSIQVAVILFAFLGIQLPTAKQIYENVRGLWFIGYSFSENEADTKAK